MDSRKLSASASVLLLLVLLFSWPAARAESPESISESDAGITSQKQSASPDEGKAGLDKSLKLLLAGDAVARALDGYSTVRMLRNRCNGDPSVPVCNQEDFLPDFITRSTGAIYAYEGGVWLAQVILVRKLHKHHPRLAKFIPAIDMAVTLPFAVNNLRLPVNARSANH